MRGMRYRAFRTARKFSENGRPTALKNDKKRLSASRRSLARLFSDRALPRPLRGRKFVSIVLFCWGRDVGSRPLVHVREETAWIPPRALRREKW